MVKFPRNLLSNRPRGIHNRYPKVLEAILIFIRKIVGKPKGWIMEAQDLDFRFPLCRFDHNGNLEKINLKLSPYFGFFESLRFKDTSWDLGTIFLNSSWSN